MYFTKHYFSVPCKEYSDIIWITFFAICLFVFLSVKSYYRRLKISSASQMDQNEFLASRDKYVRGANVEAPRRRRRSRRRRLREQKL